MFHPDIYPLISGYFLFDEESFNPPMGQGFKYVGGYVDGCIIALMVYHPFRDGSKCHVQVIPTYRAQYAIDFARRALKLRLPGRLYATIPHCFMSVLNFSKRFGFVVIDTLKHQHYRDGVLYDISLLEYR